MQQITKEKIDLSMPIKTIPFATAQRGRIRRKKVMTVQNTACLKTDNTRAHAHARILY